MKGKKLLSLLLAMIICITSVAVIPASVYADDGFVAEEKPFLNSGGIYEISTPEQLLFLSQNFGSNDCPKTGYYKLTNDIDMSSVTNYKPFGRFYGTFDGNFKKISNLSIISESGTVGLFTYIGDNNIQAVVKNLGLVDVYVKGGATVGGLTGMLFGTIENCYVTGIVVGSGLSLGGIAGRIPEDTSGTVKEPKPEEAAYPTIRNCYSAVTIRQEGSGDSQGGVSGRVLNPRTVIENCYTAGVVKGDKRVGGLVGDLRTGVLRNSAAATPYLSANSELGSAAGRVLAEPTSDKYPKASVVNIISYDKIKKIGSPSNDSFDGTAKTQTELYEQSTYEALGWDFENTWEMLLYKDGNKTYSCPVLKGFVDQEFAFDLEGYLSSIEVTPAVSDVKPDSVTINVYAHDTENSQAAITDYFITIAPKKPKSDEIVWEQQPSKIFTGLSPSTQYTFWIKVRSDSGQESGWTSVSQYTKYEILTDMTPKNISNAITATPTTSTSIVWSTDNIDLNDSTVEIVKKSVSGILPSDKAQIFKGTNEVREVHMSTNELLSDGIRNFHSVNLTGLEAGTEYVYRVGDAAQNVWSQCGSFKTAPQSDDSLLFTYYSDTQVTKSSAASAATFRTILEMFPDQAFTYSSGDNTENGYSSGQWDVLFNAGQNLFMNTIMVSAIGNHDRENYIKNYINIPDTVLPGVYSFDYGPAHFAVLNTEYYTGEELDKQIEWLRNDTNNSSKKWNIVMLHKSLYAATDHVDDEDINILRVKLAPVLQELKIDAVLMGHDHNFSRGFVKNGYNAKPQKFVNGNSEVFYKPNSPFYIVNGTAGNSKWYTKIHYDHTLYNVSPDYEFIDKTSGTYDSYIKEQSFSAVRIDGDILSLETYFLEYDPDNPGGYAVEPYLYDSIKIAKSPMISLDKTSVELKVGAEETLNAILLPEEESHGELSFTTSSSAVTVSDVTYDEESGTTSATIRGKAAGSAIITASTTDGSIKAQCIVTVKKKSSGGNSKPKPSVPQSDPDVPVNPELPTEPEIKTSGFKDLAGYSWAEDAIERLAAKGIIKGTSETTFDPGKNITRADFITLLVRAFNMKANFESNFDDVDTSAYYYQAVGIAKNLGIATGVGENSFNPENEISRQDMMVLIAKALKAAGRTYSGTASDLNKFSDAAEISGYAVESAAALVKEGIVEGKGSIIDPKGKATRAEIAVIIDRILNIGAE